MSEDELEVAVLESWLAETDFGWLEDIHCEVLEEGAVGRAEADQILQLHALYLAIRGQFPNLTWTNRAMDAFLADDAWVAPYGPLDVASLDCSTNRWIGRVGEAAAAAALGSSGDLEAVLVACDLLSHRYDSYSGVDGRPLVDGYQFFLPAVASFASATTGMRFAELGKGPGWWIFRGPHVRATAPDRLSRSLNPSITREQRRQFVFGDGTALWSEAADCYLFAPMADALKIDASFLTQSEKQSAEATLDDLVDNLTRADPGDPDLLIGEYLEPMHLAYVVAANIDDLVTDAQAVDLSDPQGMASIEERHRWIRDWGRNSWRYTQCWPHGLLREAIAESPWDWFIPGLPPR